MSLTLETDGAARLDRAALSILPDLRAIADAQPPSALASGCTACRRCARSLANDGDLGALAAAELGAQCRPVRAILFDKTETTNWALGWHQDRTIVVRERIDIAGFGPWTVKAG